MRIKTKMPRDISQLAKRVVDISTSENPRDNIVDIYLKTLKKLLEAFKLIKEMNEKERAIFTNVIDLINIQKETDDILKTLTKYRLIFQDQLETGFTMEDFKKLIRIAAEPESTFKQVKPKKKK